MKKDFKHPDLLKNSDFKERKKSVIEIMIAIVIIALIAIALAAMII